MEWWSALPVNVQSKWLADPKTPTMHEAWRERCLRKEACDYGQASVGLSGFTLSQDAEEHAARFINGEINLDEFVAPQLRSNLS